MSGSKASTKSKSSKDTITKTDYQNDKSTHIGSIGATGADLVALGKVFAEQAQHTQFALTEQARILTSASNSWQRLPVGGGNPLGGTDFGFGAGGGDSNLKIASIGIAAVGVLGIFLAFMGSR